MVPSTWCVALYTGNNGDNVAGSVCVSKPLANG
jgi:hypothetical protein